MSSYTYLWLLGILQNVAIKTQNYWHITTWIFFFSNRLINFLWYIQCEISQYFRNNLFSVCQQVSKHWHSLHRWGSIQTNTHSQKTCLAWMQRRYTNAWFCDFAENLTAAAWVVTSTPTVDLQGYQATHWHAHTHTQMENMQTLTVHTNTFMQMH